MPQSVEHDLERWRAFYRELRARRERAGEQDYYQIFGLERGAPHHAIVSAFDQASLRYHPDRYNPIRSERWGQAIHDEATSLYKVMTEGYGVLSDRRLRALYDEELRRSGRLRIDAAPAQDSAALGGEADRPPNEALGIVHRRAVEVEGDGVAVVEQAGEHGIGGKRRA